MAERRSTVLPSAIVAPDTHPASAKQPSTDQASRARTPLLIPTQIDLLVHLVIQLLQFPLLKHNNLKVVIAVKHRVLSRISLPGLSGWWLDSGHPKEEKAETSLTPLHVSECLFTFSHLQYSKSTYPQATSSEASEDDKSPIALARTTLS